MTTITALQLITIVESRIITQHLRRDIITHRRIAIRNRRLVNRSTRNRRSRNRRNDLQYKVHRSRNRSSDLKVRRNDLLRVQVAHKNDREKKKIFFHNFLADILKKLPIFLEVSFFSIIFVIRKENKFNIKVKRIWVIYFSSCF